MTGIVSDFKEVIVKEDTTFGETLERMNHHKKSITLVTDENLKLLGILTDGDIRKAILNGITLQDKVTKAMNKNPFCLTPGYADGEMIRIMMENNIFHLPIVDEHQILQGIVFQETFIQQKVLLCPVVIMAGGRGTRLYSLTKDKPKPLLEVRGKPMIIHLIERFRDEGARDFFICLNYKGEMIEEYLGDGSTYRVRINYIKENEQLGTSGALSLLPEISSPFFVINADVLASINLRAMYQFHLDNDSMLTMAIKKIQFEVPYGTVSLEHNCITHISEKPSVENYINAGIYVLDHHCLSEIPSEQYLDMTDLVSQLLSRGKKVSGYLISGEWTDVGQLKDYFQVNGEKFKDSINQNNQEQLLQLLMTS